MKTVEHAPTRSAGLSPESTAEAGFAWRGFEAGICQTSIDVRAFIQGN